MKAWRFHGVGQPLRYEDVPEPRPAVGEVLLRVEAAGLCHTDVGVLEEPSWGRRIARMPITLGHEVAGVVEAVGEDVTRWRVGDRVCVWPSSGTHPGFSRDGGFAELTTAREDDLVAVPDAVPGVAAATAADAGMTSYSALVGSGGVAAGSRVGIIGVGGLGGYAVQIARALGAEVAVADVSPAARALAADLGVDRVFDDARDFRGLDLDVIADFAGAGTTTATAVEVIGHRGTVVLVGMARDTSVLPTHDLIFNRCRLVGSMGGTADDIAAVLGLVAAGTLQPEVEVVPLSGVGDGLVRVARGDVRGRLVAVPDPA